MDQIFWHKNRVSDHTCCCDLAAITACVDMEAATEGAADAARVEPPMTGTFPVFPMPPLPPPSRESSGWGSRNEVMSTSCCLSGNWGSFKKTEYSFLKQLNQLSWWRWWLDRWNSECLGSQIDFASGDYRRQLSADIYIQEMPEALRRMLLFFWRGRRLGDIG